MNGCRQFVILPTTPSIFGRRRYGGWSRRALPGRQPDRPAGPSRQRPTRRAPVVSRGRAAADLSGWRKNRAVGRSNPWRDAWAHRPSGSGRIPLTCPWAMPAMSPRSTPRRPRPADPTRLPPSPNAMAATRRWWRRRQRAPGRRPARRPRYQSSSGIALGHLDDSRSETRRRQLPGESAGDFLKRAAVDIAAADIQTGNSRTQTSRRAFRGGRPDQQPRRMGPRCAIGSLRWAAIRKVDLLSLSRQEAKSRSGMSAAPTS